MYDSRFLAPVPRPPRLHSIRRAKMDKEGEDGEGEEEEDGVEDATLRDSNDPTNNNTKSFRKYRNTKFHRFFRSSFRFSVSSYARVRLVTLLYIRTYVFFSFLILLSFFVFYIATIFK